MSSVSDATSRLQEAFERERAQSRDAHERESREASQGYAEQLVEKSKEYNQRLASIRAEAQEDVRKLKDEVYDKNGRSRTRDSIELQNEKDRLNAYREGIDRESEQRIARVEKRAQDRAEKAYRSGESQVSKALEDQKRSHLQEVSALHDELNHYRNLERDMEGDRQRASQEVIEKNEGDHIKEKERITDHYRRQIDHLHAKQDERDEHHHRRIIEVQSDAGHKTEKQLQNQKKEFAEIDRNRIQQIHQLEDHFDQQIRSEKNKNERVLNTLVHQNNSQQEKAIENKDQVYRDYLSQARLRNEFEVASRDQEIETLKTTRDPRKISPYAVEKIQKTAEARHQQQLDAATQSYSAKLNAARERDQQDRMELKNQYDRSLSEHTRTLRSDRDLQQSQVQLAYEDLQHRREDDRRQWENQNRESVERVWAQKSDEISLQQRRHRDQLEEQRAVFREGQVRTAEELQTRNREQVRQWSDRYRDLKRSMERQLAEEKGLHEVKVSELRYEYDKRLRDSERQSHRVLEERTQAYEHQLKQRELAFQEKERFLTERYEEELDRMRLTHARLIQKKS